MTVLSPQYGENTGIFPSVSVDGIHSWAILLAIPLEFQEIKYRPFSMARPSLKGRNVHFPGGKQGSAKRPQGTVAAGLPEAKAFEERDRRHLPRHVTQKKTS